MPIDTNRSSIQWLPSIVLVLVLWTGFAFLDHMVDIDSSHHEHHHCQLFAQALHGITSPFTILPLIRQKPIEHKPKIIAELFKPLPNKKARSPPKISNQLLLFT
ncbi:DUF2607 family protein [Vibrio sp. TH_r3]|uniref:DUF2607 family protein n=1 Tax=Vibrio sp. TH_r3 TaxID=3082084 RepID=UPI00295576A3|nr:DUF2607 family protein [Vibrio sp. TH_r3]MDV7105644.1 DUF2607 family protein [Vibrio sp. TH_r3]